MKLNSNYFKWFTKKKSDGNLDKIKTLKIKAFTSLGFAIFLLVVSIILGFFALAGYKFNIDKDGQFAGQAGLTILGMNGLPITNTVAGSEVLLNYSPLVNDATARMVLSVFSVLFLTGSIIAIFLWFFYFLSYVKNPKKKIDKYDKEQLINAAENNK